MCTREPCLVLVSLLISLKSGARTLNQSLSEVLQNQSNSLITFDFQLKTALYDGDVGKNRHLKMYDVCFSRLVHVVHALHRGGIILRINWYERFQNKIENERFTFVRSRCH